MYENASNELKSLLIEYPDDASLSSSLAYTYIQQSYLLSYLPNKQPAYKKAQQATKTVNTARLQDPKSKDIQHSYYRFLAHQLMLSPNKNIDNRVKDIINFLKVQGFKNNFAINTQLILIQYFIDRQSPLKAYEFLTALESDTSYQQYIANKAKSGDNVDFTNINLLKAKLAENTVQREQFCLNALKAIAETVKINQSVHVTHPLLQAYTCLNRANEIPKIKASLVKLGITHFKL